MPYQFFENRPTRSIVDRNAGSVAFLETRLRKYRHNEIGGRNPSRSSYPTPCTNSILAWPLSYIKNSDLHNRNNHYQKKYVGLLIVIPITKRDRADMHSTYN